MAALPPPTSKTTTSATSHPAVKRARVVSPSSSLSTPPAAVAVVAPWRNNLSIEATAATAALRVAYEAALPFKHTRLHDIFPVELTRAARAEILTEGTVKWTHRRNDLYTFAQSQSLSSEAGAVRSGTALAALRDEIYSPAFRAWVSAITGIHSLAETVDASIACYRKGDHLLCHDDDLAGRAIAYIVYLTPDSWTPAHGGALALYDCDEANAPTRVTASLGAHFNSVSLFAVTARSFHAVQEVFSADARISISGWFHAANVPPRAPTPRAQPRVFTKVTPPRPLLLGDGVDLEPVSLPAWLHPRYCNSKARTAAARAFVNGGGSLQLGGFLSQEALHKLMKDLVVRAWRHSGPPSERSYRVTALTTNVPSSLPSSGACPDTVDAAFAFFSSTDFFTFFEIFTNEIGAKLSGDVSVSIVAFASGDYSLITDETYKRAAREAKVVRALGGGGAGKGEKKVVAHEDVEDDKAAAYLELSLCIMSGTEAWPDDAGGAITYLTADEEVACFVPKGNTLSIAFRPAGVYSFTKCVSAAAPETLFRIDIAAKIEEETTREGGESE